jgi:hypothetical protein
MRSLKGRGHSKDLGVNWEDNIKMDIRETELRVVDWIHLCGDRPHWLALIRLVMKLLGVYTYNAGNL